MRIILLSFLFAVNCSILGQNLKLGFQFESILFYSNSEVKNILTNSTVSNTIYKRYSPFPSSIYIRIGADITKIISLELKSGILIADDYTGFEIGLFSKYNIKSILSLIAFYNHHSNNGSSSNTGGGIINSIGLIGCGLGISLTEITTVEVLYSNTNN